jgi:hypothetical protein
MPCKPLSTKQYEKFIKIAKWSLKKGKIEQIRFPQDIAVWLKQPGIIHNLRHLIQSYKHL